MKSQENALTISQGNRLALLHQVIGQTIDTPLGEFLAAGLAGMLVAITRVLELGTSNEELEDELVGFSPHGGRVGIWGGGEGDSDDGDDGGEAIAGD